MIEGFEMKNYQQHNWILGVLNAVFAFLVLTVGRLWVLSPGDAEALQDVLSQAQTPLVSSLSLSLVLAGFFGWFSTNVLRLHDRIHEPHFVKWRAGYDSDFVLRSLCYDLSHLVSPDLFERAYHDDRVRYKMMQRLFYRFAGDAKDPHEGLRRMFYTRILKYWASATLELYALAALVSFSVYRIRVGTSAFPWAVLTATAVYAGCRVYGNRMLDALRPVSSEQVNVVLTEQAEHVESNLKALASELNATRQR